MSREYTARCKLSAPKQGDMGLVFYGRPTQQAELTCVVSGQTPPVKQKGERSLTGDFLFDRLPFGSSLSQARSPPLRLLLFLVPTLPSLIACPEQFHAADHEGIPRSSISQKFNKHPIAKVSQPWCLGLAPGPVRQYHLQLGICQLHEPRMPNSRVHW